MRHCIPCKAEYADDPRRCPACGSRTVTSEERELWNRLREDLTQEEFVPVHVFEGPVGRAIITDIFRTERIPWVVHGGDGPLSFTAQDGWGVLLVPEDYRARATRLIQDFKDAELIEPVDQPAE